MAYIDSANIKGTLYELQDTQARAGVAQNTTDIGDLKSATEQYMSQIAAESGLVLESFAVGSYDNTDGKTPIAATNRIRLNEYLDLDRKIF